MTADGGRVRPQDLLHVEARRVDAGAEVLVVSGEVDLLSAGILETAIAAALGRGPALLVIDLTGVSFLASVGMTVLLKAHRDVGDTARLRVVTPERSTVGRALKLTGLNGALAVVGTLAEALPDR
ncbi:STAS domain-containing protein [Amycolatopsis sp. RTGN1]|uniref:STAS domain-containing protein n=1 Tax=Amycolatopsis ponsaeliensis TaxID=2992142 RepID=UPI00254E538E|nr:STAS domain-containing protein [Amycolatopsis sp. RTGN1]